MLQRQNTADFLFDRLGSVGGSTVADAIAMLKRKSGDSARGARAKASFDLMYELAAERVTGQPARRVNALQWGIDHEDEARTFYAVATNAEIIRPGVIPHPRIAGAHCSPDALVGDDGGLEIKCPTSATHLQTLLNDAIPEERLPQLHWCLACCQRRWWDFCSYDPRFPEGLQLYVKRLERDDAEIARMETEVVVFLAELNASLETLAQKYGAWERP